MAIRKTDDLANETDNRYVRVKTSRKREKIEERFNDAKPNHYPGDEALQYLAKKIDDVIDETNKQTQASASYAPDIKRLDEASGSFATNIIANQSQHLGSTDKIYITPNDFYPHSVTNDELETQAELNPTFDGSGVTSTAAGTFICTVILPIGKVPTHVRLYGSDDATQVMVYANKYDGTSATHLHNNRAFTIRDGNTQLATVSGNFVSGVNYLVLSVTINSASDSIYGAVVTIA